jgi:hypothetical protein
MGREGRSTVGKEWRGFVNGGRGVLCIGVEG